MPQSQIIQTKTKTNIKDTLQTNLNENIESHENNLNSIIDELSEAERQKSNYSILRTMLLIVIVALSVKLLVSVGMVLGFVDFGNDDWDFGEFFSLGDNNIKNLEDGGNGNEFAQSGDASSGSGKDEEM